MTQMLCMAISVLPSTSYAEFHASIAGKTDNISRWFSKNKNDYALSAKLDYMHESGGYAGASISNVNFGSQNYPQDAANVELITYLGWSFKLSNLWRLDSQWSRYTYDGKVFGHDADYNEFYVFLHYHDFFSGRISYTEDYYNTGNYALDYELTGRYSLTDALQFSSSFGYSQTKAALGSDYPYWNAGLTYYYKIMGLDFRYMDATETFIDKLEEGKKHQAYDPPLIGPTFVFSVTVGF